MLILSVIGVAGLAASIVGYRWMDQCAWTEAILLGPVQALMEISWALVCGPRLVYVLYRLWKGGRSTQLRYGSVFYHSFLFRAAIIAAGGEIYVRNYAPTWFGPMPNQGVVRKTHK